MSKLDFLKKDGYVLLKEPIKPTMSNDPYDPKEEKNWYAKKWEEYEEKKEEYLRKKNTNKIYYSCTPKRS